MAGIGDTNLIGRGRYVPQQAANFGADAVPEEAAGTNQGKVDASGLPITMPPAATASTPPVTRQAPRTTAAGPAKKKPTMVMSLTVNQDFLVTQKGDVITYDDVVMKRILSEISGVEGCESRFYELKWEMLAREAAMDFWRTDITPDQATNLGKMLYTANGEKEPVWLLNKPFSMTIGNAWLSVITRFNVLPWNYTAYDDYKRFKQLADSHASSIWAGSFPGKFSFKISQEFIAAINTIKGQRVQQAQQTNVQEVKIAVFSPAPYTVRLSAKLPAGFPPEQCIWTFPDDRMVIPGKGTVERTYTAAQYAEKSTRTVTLSGTSGNIEIKGEAAFKIRAKHITPQPQDEDEKPFEPDYTTD